ncbi:MAG TPA: hypothetical protein VGI91_07230 [Steroidobacteraceae bacterium]|jgi:hypothetical protein
MDNLLAGWENFYVIVGSSAGGLTGLTFVVIALAADANRVRASGLRAFVTPTIVHFGVVLALAALLSMPHQSILTLSAGFAAIAAFGLIWSAVISINMPKHGTEYSPVIEDWIWNVILPGLVYVLVLAMSYVIWHHLAGALYGMAAAALALLFIGIHNAWDIAVWMTLTLPGKKADAPEEK